MRPSRSQLKVETSPKASRSSLFAPITSPLCLQSRFTTRVMEPVNQKKRKRSESCPQEEDHQTASGFLETLPIDIALDILSRLPIRSFIQSKCVCRAWLSLTLDPGLPHMHLVHSTESNPFLIFHSDLDNPIQNQLYFADNDLGFSKTVSRIHTPFKSVMPKFKIVGSCNGLLCLSNSRYADQLYIFNPVAGTHIELPEPIRNPNIIGKPDKLAFGFHPITKEYKVVRFVQQKFLYPALNGRAVHLEQKLEIQTFTLGTDVWKHKGYARYRLWWGRHSEVLVNGALHWKMYTVVKNNNSFIFKDSIFSFDLAEEKFQEVPRPDCGILNNGHIFDLLVFGGCLSAAVYINDLQIEIWVMKNYSVKESWTKEFTIGNYVPRVTDERNWYDPQVLCLMKNGEILLKYTSKGLVSYNQERQEFKDLTNLKAPGRFEIITHVGSLISAKMASE